MRNLVRGSMSMSSSSSGSTILASFASSMSESAMTCIKGLGGWAHPIRRVVVAIDPIPLHKVGLSKVGASIRREAFIRGERLIQS